MGKEPDEIREEIEETRSRMGDTVEAIGYKADVPARAKESVTSAKESVVGSVKGAKDRVVGSIVGAKESVTGSAGTGSAGTGSAGTGSAVADRLGSATSSISDAAPSAADVREGARRAAGVAQENPLGLALGSFAAGFLAGMVVPPTAVEKDKLGPIADQVKDRAAETGQEALERGKKVAEETAETAKSALGDVAEVARDAARQTAETAKGAAQEHGRELSSSAKEAASDLAPSSSSSDDVPDPLTDDLGSLRGGFGSPPGESFSSGTGPGEPPSTSETDDRPMPGL